MTTTERRARYAAQAGASPDGYTPTGPQARRIRHKQRRAGSSPARLAAAEQRRRAAAATAEERRHLDLTGLRFPLPASRAAP